MSQKNQEHIPVLAQKLLEQVKIPPDAVMVDATVGQGGHSFLYGEQLGKEALLIGFDVDENSLAQANRRLESLSCKTILIRENFARIREELEKIATESDYAGNLTGEQLQADFILADLGFCSAQLDDEKMGMSFLQDLPLDMRLDKRISHTAADIINDTDESALADLIYEFGEERASRRIARFIAAERKKMPIRTTGHLVNTIHRALGIKGRGRKSKIHPATRTFQALRIAVNDELGCLERFLETVDTILKPSGKVAVISFHSLEDRKVKYSFREKKQAGIYAEITKKPITADREEAMNNPRSRSAKLRIAVKAGEPKEFAQ